MENKDFNWEEVVDFFSKKYILTRASFTGSSAVITDDKVSVNLSSKGKFLLLQKNIDKTVSDFIFNTTGKRYEIEFIEPTIDNFTENRNSLEASLVHNLLEENAKRAQELQLQKNQDDLKKKEKKAREKIENQLDNVNAIDNKKETDVKVGGIGFNEINSNDQNLDSLLASIDLNNGGGTPLIVPAPSRRKEATFCTKENYK